MRRVATTGVYCDWLFGRYERSVGVAEGDARRLDNLMRAHADRVLAVDAATADEWGWLDTQGTLPVVDGLLAATARVHDFTLVTRNARDVAHTGVDLLDPFAPTAH